MKLYLITDNLKNDRYVIAKDINDAINLFKKEIEENSEYQFITTIELLSNHLIME